LNKLKTKITIFFLICVLLLSIGCTNQNDDSKPISLTSLNQNVTLEQNINLDPNSSNSSFKENITKNKPSRNNSVQLSPKEQDWWKPSPHTSWQWQLQGELNTNYDVKMYDIDLFDTSKETILALHNRGIKVVCYFSAGTYENWRIDSSNFPPAVLGNTLEGWEDEKWLDISQLDILAPIILRRLDLAVEKGCDGVEPDNVDGYLNDNGFFNF